nr:YceI family protein [uncultured Psychroserpens sp.]
MKKIIFILVLVSTSVTAQNKYLTKTGTINFEASVPSFEDVAAKSNSVTVILNTENGEIAALALVKGFRFKNALMEEHFNENYAESDKFPKATFKGKIESFDIKTTEATYILNGTLTFHGKSKPISNITINLVSIEQQITLSGSFKTKASDFDIEIPKIVRNKIAEDIVISFEFVLLKK